MITPSPLTEPMEPKMLTALDLYLSTAPLSELLTYVGLAMVTVGSALIAPGFVADHVAAYRAAR